MNDLTNATVKRVLANFVVVVGPLVAGLGAVTDKLPVWLAVTVAVLAVAIRSWTSYLDQKAPAK